MKIYNFKKEIDSEIYYQLLEYALKTKSKMVFVEMKHSSFDIKFKELIKPFILKEEEVSKWPGTVLVSEKAHVKMFILNINLELIDKIKLLLPSLSNWQAPKYPEDLSFLRPNGTPWFVSIAHENDAYMELEECEMRDIYQHFGKDLIDLFRDSECIENYLK